MEKQFVTYEIALAFKELGFDGKCYGYYGRIDKEFYNACGTVTKRETPCIIAPLWQQAIDWMLKEYQLYAYVAGNYTGDEGYTAVMVIKGARALKYIKSMVSTKFYSDPNEAREAIILKFIELVKNPKY